MQSQMMILVTNDVIKYATKNDALKYAIMNYVINKKINIKLVFPNTPPQHTLDVSYLFNNDVGKRGFCEKGYIQKLYR